METKELTNEQLAKSCRANGIYFINDDYETARRDYIAETGNATEDGDRDDKIAVMARMLDEYLDYGVVSETDDEADSEEHSDLMAFRDDLCFEIAGNWVDGKYADKDADKWLKAANEDLADMLLKHYLGECGNSVWGFITANWYDGEKIVNKKFGQFVGRMKIINLYDGSSAADADEFADEVNTYFSGSVLDDVNTPFDATEAMEYAKFTWERYNDAE